jgi:hypothetical protein
MCDNEEEEQENRRVIMKRLEIQERVRVELAKEGDAIRSLWPKKRDCRTGINL